MIQNVITKLKSNPWVKYPLETFQHFSDNNGPLNAAGLAFFMLLSFAPMILMGVALLSLVVSPVTAMHEIHVIVDNLLPSGGARDEANHLLNERLTEALPQFAAKSGLPFVVGLVSLIWASMQIYVTGSTAMNMAFQVKENRSWIKLRLIALGLLALTGLLLLVSLFLSGAPSAIGAYQLPIIEHLPVNLPIVTVIFEILAILVNGALFGAVFKFLPAAPNTWRSAAAGGLTSSILFEVAKKAMAVFLLRPNHGIYGGLADLIVFVLWIYYSMIIMILGSEVAALYARYNEPSTVGHPKGRQRTLGERIRATARGARRRGL
ncbi:MAG TPA: YihY/virulence factor BrkB family protein [Capsulimonadaceae bacterium]|jgi:membrane protein